MQKMKKEMWYIDVIVVFDFDLSHTLTLYFTKFFDLWCFMVTEGDKS